MSLFRFVLILACSACPVLVFAQAPGNENPFFKESTLPYLAPPFDKIKDADYQPAMEEGMKQELGEIEAIANNPAAPTFDNTIAAMEKSGALLRRVARVFGGITQSNTNPTLQKVQTELAPKQAAHNDAINLNPKLFQRIKAIYDARNDTRLTAEQRYVVERSYREFVRSGALLSEADKTSLRAINKEISELSNEFRKKVLADTNARALVIDDMKLLEGLPESDIAGAAEKAKEKHLDGKWVLALQNTTQQPAMGYLKNRELREKLFKTSSERCSSGENDTTLIVSRIARLRAQRSNLLGYKILPRMVLKSRWPKRLRTRSACWLISRLRPRRRPETKRRACRSLSMI